MEKEYLNNLGGFSSATNDVMTQYGEINLRAWEKLSQIQRDLMDLGVECGTRQWQILGNAKTPADILTTESDIVVEYCGKLFDDVRQAVDILTKRQCEAMACFGGITPFLERTSVTPSTSKSPEDKKRAA